MTTMTLQGQQGPSIAADAGASESRIDRDSHFNGLYQTKQNLRIEGVAEGEIQCDGTLNVAEGASVTAKVTASTISIAGDLKGEVLCRGVFQITPTGQVDATVSARRLIVHEGGVYNGEFKMIADPAPEPAADRSHSGSREAEPARDTEDTFGSDEWWKKITGEVPAAEAGTLGDARDGEAETS